MNLVEKLESWRWIRPIPSKPPKREDLKTFDSRTNCSSEKNKKKSKKFSTFASHFKEWQKEQKYSYSSTPKSGGLKFSAFSQTLAKSARKFKSEFDKINIFSSRSQRSEEIVENIPPKPKVTLLYQNTRKKRNQFVRLDELPDEVAIKDHDDDDEDVYLLPKTPKLVTFAESTSTLSFSSHSTSSVSESHWLW